MSLETIRHVMQLRVLNRMNFATVLIMIVTDKSTKILMSESAVLKDLVNVSRLAAMFATPQDPTQNAMQTPATLPLKLATDSITIVTAPLTKTLPLERSVLSAKGSATQTAQWSVQVMALNLFALLLKDPLKLKFVTELITIVTEPLIMALRLESSVLSAKGSVVTLEP